MHTFYAFFLLHNSSKHQEYFFYVWLSLILFYIFLYPFFSIIFICSKTHIFFPHHSSSAQIVVLFFFYVLCFSIFYGIISLSKCFSMSSITNKHKNIKMYVIMKVHMNVRRRWKAGLERTIDKLRQQNLKLNSMETIEKKKKK